MLKIRQYCDGLNFNIRISIPGKDSLYIETELWFLYSQFDICVHNNHLIDKDY